MGHMTFSEHDKFETIDRAQIIQFFSIPALLNPTCSFSLKKIYFLRNFKILFSNAAYENWPVFFIQWWIPYVAHNSSSTFPYVNVLSSPQWKKRWSFNDWNVFNPHSWFNESYAGWHHNNFFNDILFLWHHNIMTSQSVWFVLVSK